MRLVDGWTEAPFLVAPRRAFSNHDTAEVKSASGHVQSAFPPTGKRFRLLIIHVISGCFSPPYFPFRSHLWPSTLQSLPFSQTPRRPQFAKASSPFHTGPKPGPRVATDTDSCASSSASVTPEHDQSASLVTSRLSHRPLQRKWRTGRVGGAKRINSSPAHRQPGLLKQ